MATQLEVPSTHRRVTVLDSQVHIDDFVETDPNVHRVLVEADDPEGAVHTILRVGAQATIIARTDFEAQVVERRFEGMTRTFDTTMEDAVTHIDEVRTALLDEEKGALPRILGDMKRDIRGALEETFDEDSKTSAIAKIEAVLDGSVERLDRNIRATFDPDVPDSALAKTKREILDTVKEQTRELRKDFQDMATAVAAGKARAEATELTAIKGFSYEDVLEAGLVSIAAVHGDLVENVSTRTGVSGTKKGDHLVTLCEEDTFGQEARFVIECKDRRLSMTKTMEELHKATENHTARAAIAVFSRAANAPAALPFHWSGNRAILVYDKDDPDDDALQLAYAWARWVCRRELTAEGGSLDVGRIEAALTRARQALQKHQTARSCFTAATKKIEEGSGHVTSMVGEVRAALSELWDAVKGE